MTVLAFPGTNWRNIPSCAREFADRLEAEEFGSVARALVVLETDQGVHTIAWGEDVTPILAMGLYHAAANMAYADALDD